MSARGQIPEWGICAAIAVLCLGGCVTGATPRLGVTATRVEEATAATQPTAEALPTASPELTSAATTVAAVTPSSAPRTPTTTPTARPDTPSPPQASPTTAPTRQPRTPSPVPPMDKLYYEDRSGPVSLLASYYNAINRREYARAWAYWPSPPSPSYETFVQGFADTASVRLAVRVPIWTGAAAGTAYARVPVLLSAIHLDGSRHNFVGCFIARRFNVEGPEVEEGWSLYEAAVHPTPGNSADARRLVGVCDTMIDGAYDDRTAPVRLLASYYNAINQGDYARAWSYWETPPAPSFEEFSEGFADTASVMLVVRPPTHLEGAAGSVYAAIPALVNATHWDESRHAFLGCFVARRSNIGPPDIEREWSLFDATVQRAPGNASDVTLLGQACEAE